VTRHYVVPGRVELVGKHVDYGGGRSLTCAVEQAVRAEARPLDGPVLRVASARGRDIVEVPISAAAAATRVGWSIYVAAVARRIARDFPAERGITPEGRGVEVYFTSDLPQAAGLSSSSALTIAVARAAADALGLDEHPLFAAHAGSPLQFAEWVAAVETGRPYGPFGGEPGVGVRGGAQDHVAIIAAREGMVGQFSYIPAREERYAPWPADRALAIAVSGVRAAKTGSARRAYNRASDALRWLLQQWNRVTQRADPTLAAALASSEHAPEQLAKVASNAMHAPVSAQYLTRRLAQFREECQEIVPGVAAAFRACDLARAGALVDRSQSLAERALENQILETSHLARSARELGADAASAFGAGFGGAVWAMVRAPTIGEFLERWRVGYEAAFPAAAVHAEFLVTRPGPPAREEPASEMRGSQ
jgi:galactokinase